MTCPETVQVRLTGTTLHRCIRLANQTPQAMIIALRQEALAGAPIDGAQVNHIYRGMEDPPAGGNAEQYAPEKLGAIAAHRLATGNGVVVAVIDSGVDPNHPDLAGAIADSYDAANGEPPHPHGTGMAGAIASRYRLLGVAPGVKLIAIKAFDESATSAEATSYAILKGLDYAMSRNVRIINMSFAGPHDPMMERSLKTAHDKGVILIAAAGNAGPKSPPLYPGADSSVIAVTATDYTDKPFAMANRGKYIAVAAPGVDVMVPAPAGAYQLTTGTSVAAAHVSGVAALLLEKHPEADAQTILEVLTSSATRLGNKRDDKLGWGLVDPLAALNELDNRVTDMKVAAPATAPTQVQASTPAPPAAAATPAAASTRSTLPRPGIYAPKQ